MLLRLHEWIDGGILKQRGQMQRHSSRLLYSGKELVRFQPHAPFPGRNGKKAVGMAGLIVAVQWLVPIQLRVAVHNVCADLSECSIYLPQNSRLFNVSGFSRITARLSSIMLSSASCAKLNRDSTESTVIQTAKQKSQVFSWYTYSPNGQTAIRSHPLFLHPAALLHYKKYSMPAASRSRTERRLQGSVESRAIPSRMQCESP